MVPAVRGLFRGVGDTLTSVRHMPDRILLLMNIGYVSGLEKCVLILVEERLDFVGHVPA